MELDLNFVRAQFPAFAVEETRDWTFFENAGGSYVPATVSDRLQRFFVEHKVQPYGAFALSKQAGEEMDESYAAIASLINVPEDEITIGPSTTLNFYILAQSLRHLLRVGDEIQRSIGFFQPIGQTRTLLLFFYRAGAEMRCAGLPIEKQFAGHLIGFFSSCQPYDRICALIR